MGCLMEVHITPAHIPLIRIQSHDCTSQKEACVPSYVSDIVMNSGHSCL